ncbi:glycosyltransferase family 2 protein [Corynebacterium vitaeruminis]|uniref:glycosyltransferase family 2 protein n=1 Tax=Corynebacterium vitaeruminis TaxID=38305 RepID=UPI001E5C5A3A|nr:glycosyltransferase [Corynebacterium vitaeruminis]
MSISVCVAGFNPGKLIDQQLDSLVPQLEIGDELLLIDDHSTDGSMKKAYERFKSDPRVKYHRFSQNLGLSAGRNFGASQATNEYLAYCDSDDVLDSHWLSALRTALDDYPFIGCRLEIGEINSRWAQKALKYSPTECGLPRWVTGEKYAVGAGFGVKKELLNAVGGFDENFRGHEDVDFGIRLNRYGFPVKYCADSVVHYRLRETIKALFRQNRNYGQAAKQLLEMDRRRAPDSYAGAQHQTRVISRISKLSPAQMVNLFHPMRLTRLLGLWVGHQSFQK